MYFLNNKKTHIYNNKHKNIPLIDKPKIEHSKEPIGINSIHTHIYLLYIYIYIYIYMSTVRYTLYDVQCTCVYVCMNDIYIYIYIYITYISMMCFFYNNYLFNSYRTTL